MASNKRRRVVVDHGADRLGHLPDCLLHDLLSRLGSRQAVQTSVLSRRWRHLWKDVLRANVVVDEREFSGDQWQRFEDFADHVLPPSIPPETQHLDVFRLNLVSHMSTYSSSDRWIRRGLRRCPAAVDIRAAQEATVCWQPHCSYIASPGPQSDLSAGGSCAAGFTGRLATLRLVGVGLSGTFLEDLGRYCPVLEDLHIESCRMDNLGSIASPTLRSFAFVEPRRPLACAHFRIAAPLLARLRLELAYDGQDCYCVADAVATGTDLLPPLPSPAVTEASIRLTDTGHGLPNQRARKKRKLEFLNSMRGLLALLPNVINLHLAGFTTTALVEEEPKEFPMLHSLKSLTLEGCDLGVEFQQALAGILRNTPDLEKLGLHHCTFSDPPAKKRGHQPSKIHTSTPHVFWCEKLKSIEIKRRQEDEPHLAKILSEISEKMQTTTQWRRVKTYQVQ